MAAQLALIAARPTNAELRHRCTSYDAAYLATAEALDAPLITCDAKLRAGHRAVIRLMTPV